MPAPWVGTLDAGSGISVTSCHHVLFGPLPREMGPVVCAAKPAVSFADQHPCQELAPKISGFASRKSAPAGSGERSIFFE